MCYEWEWALVELQKKIDKIEEEKENYREDKRWIKYRKQQDLIYEEIRKNNEMEM